MSYEKLLAEVQAELVAVSAEYAHGSANEILVFASLENRTLFFDPFFVSGSHVVSRGKLAGVDTSTQRQKVLINYGTAQLRRLMDGAIRHRAPVPTVIKMRYAVKDKSLHSDFLYEPQLGTNDTIHSRDLSLVWKNEIQEELDNGSIKEVIQ